MKQLTPYRNKGEKREGGEPGGAGCSCPFSQICEKKKKKGEGNVTVVLVRIKFGNFSAEEEERGKDTLSMVPYLMLCHWEKEGEKRGGESTRAFSSSPLKILR